MLAVPRLQSISVTFPLSCLFFTLRLYNIWHDRVLVSAGASQHYHHSDLKNGDRNAFSISQECVCVYIYIHTIFLNLGDLLTLISWKDSVLNVLLYEQKANDYLDFRGLYPNFSNYQQKWLLQSSNKVL